MGSTDAEVAVAEREQRFQRSLVTGYVDVFHKLPRLAGETQPIGADECHELLKSFEKVGSERARHVSRCRPPKPRL
ncbi:hypothetical protein CVCC1112_4288 [Paenarthrobacter nicotinovorans]|nr:hypothetical protein CVCC1112_4288 [Paenarthrobacter nicotinovorans]